MRASPVVHGDETGWRENGRNGYVWTFSTPTARLFVRGSRAGRVVDEALGPDFAGVLVSDFYAAYDHVPTREAAVLGASAAGRACPAPAVSRRCRLGEVGEEAPPAVRAGAGGRHRPDAGDAGGAAAAVGAARQAPSGLRALATVPAEEPPPVYRTLAGRLRRYEGELFTFVTEPGVPADNNAAERSLRHLVIQRKISGGTRSSTGSATLMVASTLFGTWQAQGRDPLQACRDLLAHPQV